MRTITVDQAKKDFLSMIDYALRTREEINIATNKGAVVLIPEEEYEAIQETLRLLADKKSLQALLEGHRYREKGEKSKSAGIEDVFGDL